MTREEAIDILRSYLMFDKSNMQIDIALNMAIEALSEGNIARDIATILENEQDMRVMLQNDAVPNCQKCAIKELWEETEKEDLVEVVRKPIKGYEDYYEVDQFGRVFAKERTIHVTDHDREYDKHLPSRQMKQSVHTKGYKTVPLTKDGVCTTKFVHRLVAEAFIPNQDDLPFVNHIDEDKTNNFVENLEWCTEQYNSTYGKAREKHAKALKGRHHTEEHKKKISDSLKRFYGERREP